MALLVPLSVLPDFPNSLAVVDLLVPRGLLVLVLLPLRAGSMMLQAR